METHRRLALVLGGALLLASGSAGANGFALHAYGSPGPDANCWNGMASWSVGTDSGSIGKGTAYAYADVSGDVTITALPNDTNLQVTWSSQDKSWIVVSGCAVGSLTCVVRDGNYVDVNFGEPRPVLATVDPVGCEPGGPDLTLTLDSPSSSFTHQSVVVFGGVKLATTFVSTTRLTATVPAAETASARGVQVTVENPVAPTFGTNCGKSTPNGSCPSINGGASNAVDFTVVAPPPDAAMPPDADAPGEDASSAGPDAAGVPDAEVQVPPDATATPHDAAAPKPDAFEPPDAEEPADAAEPEDAAEPADAGDGAQPPRDAAVAGRDAAGRDGARDPVYDLGGCGCSAGGPAALGAGALALLVLAGRRRRG